MLENVLEKIPSEDLAVHVVWTAVLPVDDLAAARKASSLIPDARAIHYWDADQSLGLAYGRTIELPRGRELAWDIYLVFAPGVEWDGTVPPPDAWAHQLGQDSRFLGDGTALRTSVEDLLLRLKPGEKRIPTGAGS